MVRDSVSDVVVFPNYRYYEADEKIKTDWPPIASRFDVASDLWIGPLPDGDSQKIIQACTPPGFNTEDIPKVCAPVELYSFVRETPPQRRANGSEGWDEDQKLLICIALSRLVHPTTVSLCFAARVCRDPRGSIKQIRPGTLGGQHDFAFVADETRDWLTIADAKQVKSLLSQRPAKGLPEPIARAMWHYDAACYHRYIDERWTLVATGLESLIHTDRDKSTTQFKLRLPQFAAAVGAGPVSSREAGDMYDLRSSLAHGQGLPEAAKSGDGDKVALYTKMEGILRSGIRHAIMNPDFAAFLADKNRVRKEWAI